MLERLLKKLADGPFETGIVVHGPSTQLALKVRIITADQVGITASVKGMMGGWSEETGYPWTAITKVSL